MLFDRSRNQVETQLLLQLSDTERAMLMGGATAKAYGWSRKKGWCSSENNCVVLSSLPRKAGVQECRGIGCDEPLNARFRWHDGETRDLSIS